MEIPKIGFGTYRTRDNATEIVKDALECGYNLIDTAQIYRNESQIGEALSSFMKCRSKIFITTKISTNHIGREEVFNSIIKSLEDMNLSYIDLILIHWPGTKGYKVSESFNKQNRFNVYRALIEAKEKKICRFIGVSNFTRDHLTELMQEFPSDTPYLNQFEIHPLLFDESLISFCKHHSIKVQSYSTLGEGRFVTTMRLPIVKEIAEEINSSEAQVILSWALNNGLYIIPKASSRPRMLENLNAANIILTKDQMMKIDELWKSNSSRFCWDPTKVL